MIVAPNIPEEEKTIFIQIASYRDPELLPTIRDCIFKASNPKRLRFGIAWQNSKEDTWDDMTEFKDDDRFRIVDIDYKHARGACWARNLLQQYYEGEHYTLQLDSHHRFNFGWDYTLIRELNKLKAAGFPKPLLTAYVPSYVPEECRVPQNLLQIGENYEVGSEKWHYIENETAQNGRVKEAWWMQFDRFIPEGAIFFLPANIEGWKDMKMPIPSRFYSAHFCFADGSFVKEVPHDPEYYFHGEEISIAARAYTHGYDLFHPVEPVVWHEYTRRGRLKHWDDHGVLQGELNNKCHARNRILFGMDGNDPNSIDFGIYGFGKERTLEDYERYAGLSFSQRAIQPETADNKYCPNPYKDLKTWNRDLQHIFKHCLDIGFSDIPENDYDVFAVAFFDKDGTEIMRLDALQPEIDNLKRDPDGYGKLWRTFYTKIQPKKWLVWPHSISKGWMNKIERPIG